RTAPGVDRVGQPAAVGTPTGTIPEGTERNDRGRRGNHHLGARKRGGCARRWKQRLARQASGAEEPGDIRCLSPRRSCLSLITHVRRKRYVNFCSRSVRIPTATVWWTPRRGSPASTPSCSVVSAKTP